MVTVKYNGLPLNQKESIAYTTKKTCTNKGKLL